MTSTVRIYTTRFCGYCVAAKRLLAKRGVAYEEVDVSGDGDERARLREVTGLRTVPQIFIRGEPIGGYEELKALDASGKLAQILGDLSPRDDV